MSFKNSQTI